MELVNSKAKVARAEQHHCSWESPLEEPGENPKVCSLHTLFLPAGQPLPGAGVGSLEFSPGIQVTLAAPGAQSQISLYLSTSFGLAQGFTRQPDFREQR